MTNPTLERAARAAWYQMAVSDLVSTPNPMQLAAAERVARAVLMAVRSPDRRWAADVCEDICEPELVFNPAPASAFTAMIDAILAEGE